MFGIDSLKQLPPDYKECFRYRWHSAVHELTKQLRDSVLLPLDPRNQDNERAFDDPQSGVSLPVWHCPFLTREATGTQLPCRARECAQHTQAKKRGSYEAKFFAHVRDTHGLVLKKITAEWKLKEGEMSEPEIHLTLLHAAMAEKERQSVPLLGHSIDRRVMQHVSEVFTNDTVQVLMCFICACKELAHSGYDKFGKGLEKGNICYRRGNKKALLSILQGDPANDAWEYNMSSKRFKDRFGRTVASDPDMAESSFEWFRKVKRKSGVERILCCPEDVRKTEKCKHDDISVCEHCDIPICNECYRLSLAGEKIDRSLTNDNFIGYAHEYIIKNKVRWLEATIACPVFSGLITYYIEGDGNQRGHLMEEELAKPQRAWAVRGSLFSFYCLGRASWRSFRNAS